MVFLKRIDAYLTAFEKGFVGAGILVTTVLVFSMVITRYFFDFTFAWLEEMTENITLWVVFIGAAVCVKKNEHVSVDIIFHIIPKRCVQALLGVLAILSAFFLCYFAYASLVLVRSVKNADQVSISMPWLPMFVVYLAAVLGSSLMILEFIKVGYQFLSGQREIPREKAD